MKHLRPGTKMRGVTNVEIIGTYGGDSGEQWPVIIYDDADGSPGLYYWDEVEVIPAIDEHLPHHVQAGSHFAPGYWSTHDTSELGKIDRAQEDARMYS